MELNVNVLYLNINEEDCKFIHDGVFEINDIKYITRKTRLTLRVPTA
jgi:hypothetical protein